MVTILILVVLLAFALAVVFVFPSWDVTQLPGKWHRVWEILLPGTSPAWSYFGGLALVAWCYLFVQDFFLFKMGSPYILTFIATPNVRRSFAVPSTGPKEVFALLNPSWIWVYLAPAILFVVNLFLVLRARRRA
jgi:hypothetical protein